MNSTELDFDPYAVWLNVQTNGHPLNAYEILGLEVFEESPTRLRAAISRKREMLLARRPEADPELWQALNAELETAIDTLQSNERRAVLDATLRRRGQGPARKELPPASSATLPMTNGKALNCRH